MKKSNGTALVAIIFCTSLLGACATSPANETAAKPSSNRVENEDVQSSYEGLSIGDSALIRTSDGTTHNIVISKISNTVLVGSPTKVASSSSRGKLTEYGKQKTEKLRGQTSKSKTIRLNIADIKDVEITSEIKKKELNDKLEKDAEVFGGALAGTAVVGAVAAVVAAAVVLPMLLFVI